MLRRRAIWIADNEFWLCAIFAVPFLVASSLPTPVFAAALAPIPLFWLARRIARGSASVSTPLDLPILLLLVMGVVGVIVSAEPAVSLRVFAEFAAGAALFYSLVNGWLTRDVRVGVAILLGLGSAMGLVGILGLRYSEKFLPLPLLAPLLPQLDFSFLNARGFTPNIVAGAAAPVIPLCGAWAAGDPSLSRRNRLLLLVLSLFLGLLVLLAQSRGALLGLTVGVVVLIIWRTPRLLWFAPLGALALAGVTYGIGAERIANVLLSTDATGNAVGRLELWDRALLMLQDFPLTGIGVGRFQQVVTRLYPLFVSSPDAPLPHAHNLYLEMGIDYGLPGLVAFVGLAAAALCIGIFTLRRLRNTPRAWLAAGALAGYVVYLTHGFLDAVSVSTKVSFIVWSLLAVMMVLALQTRPKTDGGLPRVSSGIVRRISSRDARPPVAGKPV